MSPLARPRTNFGGGGLAACAVLAFSILAGSPASAADCRKSPRAGIDWSDCDRSQLILSGEDLSDANLVKTDFSRTDLRSVNLKSANLEKSVLFRASLADAIADGANFARTEAYRTDFTRLSAAGASFLAAELQRADFSQAMLSGAVFEKAELGRAMFDEAVLDDARFSFANLARADFSRSKLGGAPDFSRAFMFLTRIEGLDLSKATGLTQDQIDFTCGDADTKLPEGLKPSAYWPCEFD